MKLVFYIVLVALVLLALSSAISKIMLVQQEVDFFAQYGFTPLLLRAFGIFQLAAAILLAVPRTRTIGAALVAASFLLSLIILLIAGNWVVAFVTLIFIALLGFVVKQSRQGVSAPPTVASEP